MPHADDITPAPRRASGHGIMEDARRLLMRLGTQMQSHALDLTRAQPQASSAAAVVDLTPSMRAGSREHACIPNRPRTHNAAMPAVLDGDASGVPSLAIPCVASGDQTPFAGNPAVFVRDAPMALPAPTLAHPVLAAGAVAVLRLELRLGDGNAATVLLPAAAETYRLPVTRPEIGSHRSKRAADAALIALASVRLVPDRIVGNVALERRRASLPAEDSPAGRAAHRLTRQLLAKAAGPDVLEDEIVIVGIYRRVPIGAAAQIAVDDQTNALCVYLRPDAARMVQSREQQIVSLVFGRVRSDGRLVRALVPPPLPSR